MNRRSFIDFLGKGIIATPLVPPMLSSCSGGGEYLSQAIGGLQMKRTDDVSLLEGLEMEVLIKAGDPISTRHQFGQGNAGLAFFPDRGWLWVNHERVDPRLKVGYSEDKARLRSEIVAEMADVGGSLLKLDKSWGSWSIDQEAGVNARLTGSQQIPFNWPQPLKGAQSAFGTVANGGATVTPWGTILSCEGDYQFFYGDREAGTGAYDASELQWEVFFPKNLTDHYGWIVEYDPATQTAQKHVALGRFAHGCATIKELDDKRVVVYSTDNRPGGCLYKFVSDQSDSLDTGRLFVGNFSAGRWEEISFERTELRHYFQSETEMLLRAPEAAAILGGTPMDRPADMAIDPMDGSLVVALTNDQKEENFFGSVMKIAESEGSDGLDFSYDTYVTGGEETGFACPSRLAFDALGSLWFTSEIPAQQLNDTPYDAFGHNGLFVLPRSGVNEGQVIQVASAPVDAVFAGLCFVPDGSLLLSVQGPGSLSSGPDQLTSHWPEGNGQIPRSAVIVIKGDLLAT